MEVSVALARCPLTGLRRVRTLERAAAVFSEHDVGYNGVLRGGLELGNRRRARHEPAALQRQQMLDGLIELRATRGIVTGRPKRLFARGRAAKYRELRIGPLRLGRSRAAIVFGRHALP